MCTSLSEWTRLWGCEYSPQTFKARSQDQSSFPSGAVHPRLPLSAPQNCCLCVQNAGFMQLIKMPGRADVQGQEMRMPCSVLPLDVWLAIGLRPWGKFSVFEWRHNICGFFPWPLAFAHAITKLWMNWLGDDVYWASLTTVCSVWMLVARVLFCFS